MFNKKTISAVLLSTVLFSISLSCQAAKEPSKDIAAQKALTLEISAPNQQPGLQPNERPNPVFLQITMNNGSAPVYSAPIIPGETKSTELKIVSPSSNGAQIQFITSIGNNIQPMSFVYSFTQDRLTCLINNNAKIQVIYDIVTKMLDVKGIPANC